MRVVEVTVLCEGREDEFFLRALLERIGFKRRNIHVTIAPPARGAAEQAVRNAYSSEVRLFRQALVQRGKSGGLPTALLVMVDGDKVEVKDRKHQLDKRLQESRQEPRGGKERIAILVPTWSIETWTASLSGWTDEEGQVTEGRSYKEDAGYRRGIRTGAISVARAIDGWMAGAAVDELPSLKDGRAELHRVSRRS